MKTESNGKSRNKLPLWARFFGILIGFPMLVGILRALLEHWLPRLTADLLLVVVLIIICIPLFWKRKKDTRQTPDTPATNEERHYEKREEHQFYCATFVMFTIVLLSGTFIGFCILFSATPPGYPALLFCVFRFFGAAIGIVCLVLTFVCFEQTRSEILMLKGAKPPRSVTVSIKAALCALLIILAIAFAIAKAFRL